MKNNSVKSRLKVNDNVMVISGAERGKRGKLLFIDRNRGLAVVEGINKKKKFLKPSQENPKGGILSIERPVNISNVQYFCEKCKKNVKIGIKQSDKTKERVCNKCGKSLV